MSPSARFTRLVARPVTRFLEIEAAGSILLLSATVAALVWANSAWSAGYEELWTAELGIEIGPFDITEDLRHWVNDGLMALFFFVVGLEIKREVVHGQLSERRDAALPVIAALGGMLVPAAVYLALNVGTDGVRGWGIPMATDIAFAVGVLTLLGNRVPAALKVLLLSLAIVDDLGAIAVIAVVYTESIELAWLGAAGAGLVTVVVLRRAKVTFLPVFLVVGVATWACTLESGVHATIAGVALGLLTPATPGPAANAERDADHRSVAERLEQLLHPWTSYLVIPVFALANAGIPLSGRALSHAATSTVTAGVVLGLVVGKVIGVAGAAWLAVRLGVGRLPTGVTSRHVVGMAALAGIGFTVSLFVTGLAFDDQALQDEARIGVLVASLVAAGAGTILLGRRGLRPDDR